MQKKNKNNLVFISGNFITAHIGHIRLFNFAKSLGKKLIVGVFSDKLLSFKSPVKQKQRINALKLNNLVDKVVLIDNSLNETILNILPDCIIKGSEYKTKKNSEKSILKKINCKLIFFEDKSLELDSNFLYRENLNFFNSEKLIKLPTNFMKKHDIKIDNLKRIINKFKSQKVCVIGDLIIDQYFKCEEIGISKEDSSIVVRPYEKNLFIGGAGIVASHVSGLGAKVDLYSNAANDLLFDFAKRKLISYGVNFIPSDNIDFTISKKRYLDKSKILFRVNNYPKGKNLSKKNVKLLKLLKNKVNEYDLVILSDFNYGCLSRKTIEEISKIFHEKKVIIVGDSQSSSQKGDIKKFKNFDLVTPTEYELRLNLNDFKSNITFIANKYIKSNSPKNIIIKLGKDGIFIHKFINKNKVITDSLEALNLNPVNVSGAGDAFLVVCSLSLSIGSSIWESSLLGSLCSALQISREGNIPISKKEFIDLLN